METQSKQIEELQRKNLEFTVRQSELQRDLTEMSNTMMIVQDQLESLKVLAERVPTRPDPKGRATQKIIWLGEEPPSTAGGEAKTKPTNVAVAKSTPSTKDVQEPFLFPTEPGDENLPTLKLSNEDLDRKNLRNKLAITKPTEVSRPSPQKGSAKVEKSSGVDEQDRSANQAYTQAFKLFEEGKYGLAIQSMQEFVLTFRNHRYADNAQFWLAESYFRQDHFAKALIEFKRLEQEFPHGNKVPDAILRAGSCYVKLSKMTEAKAMFHKLLKDYPQSFAAQRAEEWLASLKESGKGRT